MCKNIDDSYKMYLDDCIKKGIYSEVIAVDGDGNTYAVLMIDRDPKKIRGAKINIFKQGAKLDRYVLKRNKDLAIEWLKQNGYKVGE